MYRCLYDVSEAWFVSTLTAEFSNVIMQVIMHPDGCFGIFDECFLQKGQVVIS